MDVEMDESGIVHGCRRLCGHGMGQSLGLEGTPARPSRADSLLNGGALGARSPCGTRDFPAPSGFSPRSCLKELPQELPQAASRGRQARFQSWGMSWAQTAIIPTNSAIDANAAASSTKTFNMPASSNMEHMKNIVPILFLESRPANWLVSKITPVVNS